MSGSDRSARAAGLTGDLHVGGESGRQAADQRGNLLGAGVRGLRRSL